MSVVTEELAVIGANNDEMVCPLSNPPLSSITIPWNRIGAGAGHGWRRCAREHALPASPFFSLPAVDDPDLRRVLQLMRDTFEVPITVETLCTQLRLNRRTFQRRFTQYLQATPWEILTRFRLDRATALLSTTDLPIARIAEGCGFSDAERFATTFRIQTGLSPSKSRASCK